MDIFSFLPGRERKANEKLANQIFSRNRRQSAPSKLKTQATAPTLASRISKKVSTLEILLTTA